MSKFFKSNKKPEVEQVDMFNGDVGKHCTDLAEWRFGLPIELCNEVIEKYHVPKTREVIFRDERIPLRLMPEMMTIEYSLASYNDRWLRDDYDFENDDYIGDDFRTAMQYDGIETILLRWFYAKAELDEDDEEDEIWEGYVGDKFINTFEPGYEYDYDQEAFPTIEITGEDKENLLEDLHEIMIKVIDGDKKKKEKLYWFNGD